MTSVAFSNGMEFLFPRTEDGPSIYALLEASWTLAALIQGIRQEVWDKNPLEANPIAAAWGKLGLVAVTTPSAAESSATQAVPSMFLTPAGTRVVSCAGLLEYEFSMLQQQLDGNFVTDPAKYAALRSGLDNYAQAFLPDMQDWINKQVVFDGALLFDYCGGDGGYLARFLKHWPAAQGMLFDRNPALPRDSATAGVISRMGVKAGDAFGDHDFFAGQAGAYDLVIMSEILHCKGLAERTALLQRGKSLLKPNGALLVIEQYPNLRLEWRMRDLTSGGQCLSEEEVVMEASAVGLLGVSGIHSFTHYGIRFEAESV